MSSSRAFVLAVVLAAAWFGRGLVDFDEGVGDEPFVPVARHIEPDPIDLEWAPTDGVRDPFAPVVPPSVG
jgi:hypothetical protein